MVPFFSLLQTLHITCWLGWGGLVGQLVGWLLMFRFLDVLHLPSYTLTTLKDICLRWLLIPWPSCRLSQSIEEFGSLCKMQWGCGRTNSLLKWAPRQSCPVYSLKSTTLPSMEDQGLLCSNILHFLILLSLLKSASVLFW